jgi:hypothetical protein
MKKGKSKPIRAVEPSVPSRSNDGSNNANVLASIERKKKTPPPIDQAFSAPAVSSAERTSGATEPPMPRRTNDDYDHTVSSVDKISKKEAKHLGNNHNAVIDKASKKKKTVPSSATEDSNEGELLQAKQRLANRRQAPPHPVAASSDPSSALLESTHDAKRHLGLETTTTTEPNVQPGAVRINGPQDLDSGLITISDHENEQRRQGDGEFPILEATLVQENGEENNDRNIIPKMAIADVKVEEEESDDGVASCCSQGRLTLAFVGVLALGATIAGVAIALSGGGDDGGGSGIAPPSMTAVPSVSLSPSASPSVSLRPSAQPSVSFSPTDGPVVFADRSELLLAVDSYLLDNDPDTVVAMTYGHPIGSWDVSAITDFSSVFDDTRNPLAKSFNEGLNDVRSFRRVYFARSNL